MKFILLAATALMAAPLAAQTTPPMPADQPMPAEQTTTDPTPESPAPMPMQAQTGSTTDTDATGADAAPMSTTSQPAPGQMQGQMQGSTMTPGGYQPSAPAMSGEMTPGATVVFKQSASPDQAYPAPAALAKYPICKKGQYDKCMQPGGR